MSDTRQGISLVLVVKNVASTVSATISAWASGMSALGREWELLVIDDGSTDGTVAAATKACDKVKLARLLPTPAPTGFGACVRSALPQTRFPLLAIATTDYPYTPADLGRMVEKLGRKEMIYDRELEVVLVNGCRMGVPVPTAWRRLGWVIRKFARVALGLPLTPLTGWLGRGEHFRSWYAWFVFGNPFIDPNCGLKLMRKSLIESFPIQSDGDFAHAEIIAKTTFLTQLADELPLTPKAVAVPSPLWSKIDRKRLFRHPQFRVESTQPVDITG